MRIGETQPQGDIIIPMTNQSISGTYDLNTIFSNAMIIIATNNSMTFTMPPVASSVGQLLFLKWASDSGSYTVNDYLAIYSGDGASNLHIGGSWGVKENAVYRSRVPTLWHNDGTYWNLLITDHYSEYVES